MNPWLPFFVYWLKMLLISAVMLGYYRLFLRNAAAHTFNRFYLLAAAFLAVLLPFLRIPLPGWTDPVHNMAVGLVGRHLPPPVHGTDPVQAINTYQESIIRQAKYVFLLYGLIALGFLWPLVRSLFVIRRLKRRYTPEQVADIYVYPTREAGTPFSFFNHLFWNEALATDTASGKLIFRHELYHIRQLHTLDILALETLRRLFWCNPFLYLLLREEKEVHEFLADQYALQSGVTPYEANAQRAAYAELLVWQSQGITNIPHLVHSFYHTEIKRRVALILQPPAGARHVVRWLSLPLTLALLFAFATQGVYRGHTIPDADRPTLQDMRLTRFFLHHLRYPEKALEQGVEGSIWLSVEMNASGSKIGSSAGTGELNPSSGTSTKLTVTARALNAQQQVAEPDDVEPRKVFLTEAIRVFNLLDDTAVACPPGTYYFSVAFKIEK